MIKMQGQQISKKLTAILVSLMALFGSLALLPSTANAAETQLSDPTDVAGKQEVLGSDTLVKGVDHVTRGIQPQHQNMFPTFTIDAASSDVMTITEQGNVFEWKDSQGNLILHIDSPELPSGRPAMLKWDAGQKQLVIAPKSGFMPRCGKGKLGEIAANIGWGIGVCLPAGLANVIVGAVCTIGQSVGSAYIPRNNVC